MIKTNPALRFTGHLFICVGVLFIIWFVPLFSYILFEAYRNIFDAFGFLSYAFLFICHFALILSYYKRQFSLFALPLAHLIFWILSSAAYFVVYLITGVFDFGYMAVFYFIFGGCYFIPFTIITSLISTVITLYRKRRIKDENAN